VILTCGATETRTPDLLHAMERRTVHHGPRQFTRDPSELAIRPEQVTCVHQGSPRMVTSSVTSPPCHYRYRRIAITFESSPPAGSAHRGSLTAQLAHITPTAPPAGWNPIARDHAQPVITDSALTRCGF
jgi:hypothetical protein